MAGTNQLKPSFPKAWCVFVHGATCFVLISTGCTTTFLCEYARSGGMVTRVHLKPATDATNAWRTPDGKLIINMQGTCYESDKVQKSYSVTLPNGSKLHTSDSVTLTTAESANSTYKAYHHALRRATLPTEVITCEMAEQKSLKPVPLVRIDGELLTNGIAHGTLAMALKSEPQAPVVYADPTTTAWSGIYVLDSHPGFSHPYCLHQYQFPARRSPTRVWAYVFTPAAVSIDAATFPFQIAFALKVLNTHP